MQTKADFDARYVVRESGRGFGMWDKAEGKFVGRHGIERHRVEQMRAFARQHCEA